MESQNLDKETIKKHEIERLASSIGASKRTVREKVALTCKILFDHGHDSGLSGQITARQNDGNYITQRLGLGFDEIHESNLLEVNRDLVVIDGYGIPNPANRFHSWIYQCREDVQCIVHTHPYYSSALAMIGKPLQVAHMDSCILYGQVGFVSKWPGVPVGNCEGELIAQALADKKALLLANHGLIVAGGSVEEACILALQFERTAQLQMLALAAGDIKELDPGLAQEAQVWTSQPARITAQFEYYVRKHLRNVQS
ncbi:MAG: aldolase [Pseudomonadota bacterium]|nr:aldolase [Pseudomonadota bacterium]